MCNVATVAAPLGTAYTYQGRLADGGQPVTGIYDLRFAIFDAAGGGNLLAVPITNTAVGVNNGLFTVVLDFGSGAFGGEARWLEIAVRTNTGGAFTTLAPRQELMATPYALYAAGAALADGSVTSAKILDAAVATADLADNSVTSAKIVDGAVANADIGGNAVTTTKILDGTILGADLVTNTVTSLQLADSIDLGSTAVSGLLNVYRTAANTPSIVLDGSTGSIRGYGSDGAIRTELLASSLYGALYLRTTNGALRAYMVGNNSGSAINLYQADGDIGVELAGDDAGAGSVSVRNTNGVNRVYIDGQGNAGGGQINLYTGNGHFGARLFGDSGGTGLIMVYNTNGITRLELDGDEGDGGAIIRVRNTNNTTIITLDGHYGTGGDGKITCDILQITWAAAICPSILTSAPPGSQLSRVWWCALTRTNLADLCSAAGHMTAQ